MLQRYLETCRCSAHKKHATAYLNLHYRFRDIQVSPFFQRRTLVLNSQSNGNFISNFFEKVCCTNPIISISTFSAGSPPFSPGGVLESVPFPKLRLGNCSEITIEKSQDPQTNNQKSTCRFERLIPLSFYLPSIGWLLICCLPRLQLVGPL
mgnify:FL=1